MENWKPSRKTLQIAEQLVKRRIKMNQLHSSKGGRARKKKKYCLFFVHVSQFAQMNGWKEVEFLRKKFHISVVCVFAAPWVWLLSISMKSINCIKSHLYKEIRQETRLDQISESFEAYTHVRTDVRLCRSQENENFFFFFGQNDFKWKKKYIKVNEWKRQYRKEMFDYLLTTSSVRSVARAHFNDQN